MNLTFLFSLLGLLSAWKHKQSISTNKKLTINSPAFSQSQLSEPWLSCLLFSTTNALINTASIRKILTTIQERATQMKQLNTKISTSNTYYSIDLASWFRFGALWVWHLSRYARGKQMNIKSLRQINEELIKKVVLLN